MSYGQALYSYLILKHMIWVECGEQDFLLSSRPLSVGPCPDSSLDSILITVSQGLAS